MQSFSCAVDFTIEGVRVNIFVHYLLAVYNFLSSALTRSKLESPLSPSGTQASRQTSRYEEIYQRFDLYCRPLHTDM